MDCVYDRELLRTWTECALNATTTAIGGDGDGDDDDVWTSQSLATYFCEYRRFIEFQRSLYRFRYVLYFVGGCAGVLSAALALLTFSRREFNALSFRYHRAINAVELAVMVMMIERAVQDYTAPAFLQSRLWMMYAVHGTQIGNVLPTWVNIVILFIAVERAVACLAPNHYSLVNQPRVFWLVLWAALLVSTVLWTPAVFAYTVQFDNRSSPGRYMPVWNDFGKSRAYYVYSLLKYCMAVLGSVLFALATVTAVVGLRRTARRNLLRRSSSRALVVNAGGAPPPPSSAGYWHLLTQLSYLQLCETVPLIFLQLLYVVCDSFSWDYQLGGGLLAPCDVRFSRALDNLAAARRRQNASACLDVANVAAHCFHFYWYLLFCPKVRRGFLDSLSFEWVKTFKRYVDRPRSGGGGGGGGCTTSDDRGRLSSGVRGHPSVAYSPAM